MAMIQHPERGKKDETYPGFDGQGRIVTSGGQVMLGGNDSYVAMCHQCWKRTIREQQKSK